MNAKNFLKTVSNGEEDILEIFINLLKALGIDYCLIGGLGVNAYVEPVVSLDLDIVVTLSSRDILIQKAAKFFKIEEFDHSINLNSDKSDLRIQIQKDPEYQEFISRASCKNVMGYQLKVASLEDVLQGKIWAYSDKTRRQSKRQKDLADIIRLVETYPKLKKHLPDSIKIDR